MRVESSARFRVGTVRMLPTRCCGGPCISNMRLTRLSLSLPTARTPIRSHACLVLKRIQTMILFAPTAAVIFLSSAQSGNIAQDSQNRVGRARPGPSGNSRPCPQLPGPPAYEQKGMTNAKKRSFATLCSSPVEISLQHVSRPNKVWLSPAAFTSMLHTAKPDSMFRSNSHFLTCGTIQWPTKIRSVGLELRAPRPHGGSLLVGPASCTWALEPSVASRLGSMAPAQNKGSFSSVRQDAWHLLQSGSSSIPTFESKHSLCELSRLTLAFSWTPVALAKGQPARAKAQLAGW